MGRVIELEFAFIQVLPRVQAVPQMGAIERALAAYSSDTSIGAQSSFASDFAGAVKSGLTVASQGPKRCRSTSVTRRRSAAMPR